MSRAERAGGIWMGIALMGKLVVHATTSAKPAAPPCHGQNTLVTPQAHPRACHLHQLWVDYVSSNPDGLTLLTASRGCCWCPAAPLGWPPWDPTSLPSA